MVSSCENHSDESQIYSSRTAEWGPKWNFRPWKFTCKNCSNCYSLLPERKPITFGMEKKIEEEEWCQYFSTERWGGGGRTTKRWPAPGAILVKKDPSGNKCCSSGGGYCNWLKRGGGDLVDYPFKPLLRNTSSFRKKGQNRTFGQNVIELSFCVYIGVHEWLVIFGKWPVEKWILATVIYATHILWPFCVPPEMCGDHIKKLNMEWNHSNIVYIFTFMARSTNTPTETINEDT